MVPVLYIYIFFKINFFSKKLFFLQILILNEKVKKFTYVTEGASALCVFFKYRLQ